MSEQDHDDVRRLLQQALPPMERRLARDLWPSMARRLDAPAPRIAWYDWALAGLASAALVAVPDLVLVLVYHL
jgi:hypothetical protein